MKNPSCTSARCGFPSSTARASRRAFVAALGWCLVFAWVGGGGLPTHAAGSAREHDVKAAFLYNFASFIEWPADAFPEQDSPLVIGVVGEDPFGGVLDELVAGERVHGRPIQVRRFVNATREGYESCHMLFVSRSETRVWRTIAQRVHGRPVLTVADIPGFTEDGGTIGFTTVGRVRFSINTAALELARLSASSKLLRLARVTENRNLSP